MTERSAAAFGDRVRIRKRRGASLLAAVQGVAWLCSFIALTNMNGELRTATMADAEAIERLIPISVRKLQAAYYSPAQMEAALGPVFALDRQLIRDGTYFVAEHLGEVIGCGGWSRRKSLFGGDHIRSGPDPLLEPRHEPARIRAFFIHPDWARRGIAKRILEASERAIIGAGFQRMELVATLAGEPFYAAQGYGEIERYEIQLEGGLGLPAVRMGKRIPEGGNIS